MSNSSYSRFGRWDDEDYDSNHRAHKKPRYSPTSVIEEEVDSPEKKPIIKSIVPESDRWVATRFLGSGSYGSVHLALSSDLDNLDEEIAVKSNEISKASRLIKEEKFLTRFNKCPFVVSCYGHEFDDIHYNLLLEYCPGQCLAKYIKRRQGRGIAEDDVKRLASEILVGLKTIHQEKIIHCDIKPKNILLAVADWYGIGENNPFRAVISGFGKAIEEGSIEGEGWSRSRRGTTRFMSPELMRDMVLDYGGDVWAFGCTVLEMLTGEKAWGEHGELDWEDWITLIGESGLVPYVPESLSEEAQDFLSKCLERDPAQRWSVDCLLNHPFLKGKYPQEEDDEEEEEEEEEIGGEANLEEEEVYEEEEEAIEIDEEYPKEEDSDDDP